MITLCGYPISNYYNKIKLALIEKDLPFKEEKIGPSQEPEFLAQSPFGKIPFIKIGEEKLCETSVILEYLDESCPDKKPLFPKAPLAAAHCRLVIAAIDTYIDASARTLLRAAYFGGSATDEQIAAAEAGLARYVPALTRLARFQPYIAGGDFTAADTTAIFTLPLASGIMAKLDRPDPLADVPGLEDYYAMMRQRPSVQRVLTDWQAAVDEYFGDKAA